MQTLRLSLFRKVIVNRRAYHRVMAPSTETSKPAS